MDWATAGVTFGISLIGSGVLAAVVTQSMTRQTNRELESLKSRLSHDLVISRTQWDAEFAAYQSFWPALGLVRGYVEAMVDLPRKASNLRWDIDQHSDRHEKVVLSLAKQAIEAMNTAVLAIHNNAPFYPKEVREQAYDASKTAQITIEQFRATGIWGWGEAEWYKQRKQEVTIFQKQVDDLEGLIRRRLESVRVEKRHL